MAELTITPGDVAPVEVYEQFTGPTDEAVNAGQAVRLATATGKITLANGSAAGEARARGIALNSAGAGETVTAVKRGIIDVGNALGDLTYDDDVFLSDTDGTLADAAGTVSKIVGQTVPAWGATTADKLLHVNL